MAEEGRKVHPGPVFDEFYQKRPLKIPALTSNIEQMQVNERRKYVTGLTSLGQLWL